MSSTQLCDEGLCKHSFQLRGIEGPRVLSRPFERMEGWVKISRLTSDIGARGLLRRHWAGKGLYFLFRLLALLPCMAEKGHKPWLTPELQALQRGCATGSLNQRIKEVCVCRQSRSFAAPEPRPEGPTLTYSVQLQALRPLQQIRENRTSKPTIQSIMAVAPPASSRIDEARKSAKTDPLKAEAIYKDILSKKPGTSDAALREYEAALIGLGESYRATKKVNELAELVKSSTSSLSAFTKAKTAKLGMLF